jgi:hypothetical protein
LEYKYLLKSSITFSCSGVDYTEYTEVPGEGRRIEGGVQGIIGVNLIIDYSPGGKGSDSWKGGVRAIY